MGSFHARLLATKVFLEGCEIPSTSVRVQGGVKAPCVCTVEIPYTDAAHKLAPRSLVHVFVMDSKYEGGTTNRIQQNNTGNPESGPLVINESSDSAGEGLSARLTDPNDLDNYKLMFVGEVIKYKYNKVGSLRRIVLICQDFTRYWQDAKLYWGRRNTSLHSYKQAIFAGATQLYRGRRRVDSSSDLINLLRARPSANRDIPGLLGGLIATLESVTGVFSPDATRRYRGVNDYMSFAEMRLHLTRTIGASHLDDSSSTFINSRAFRRYLRRVSRQVKSTASFYDMMNMVIEKCYQTWNSVPCPPLVGEERIEIEYLQRVSGYNFRNNAQINSLYQAAESMYNHLTTDVQNALEVNRAGGPDERIQSGRDSVRYRRDGERTVANQASHESVQEEINRWNNTSPALREGVLQPGSSSGLDAIRDDLVNSTANLRGGSRTASIQAGQGVAALAEASTALANISGSTYDSSRHTMENYNEARRHLGASLEAFRKAAGVHYQRRTTTTDIRSRLHCFLFHPDIYMLPPPKCNVIFPDHVTAISFSRNWMSEISRIWLHGRTSSGRDRRNCYFAPNTSILGATLQEGSSTYGASDIAAEAVRRGTGFLMPHEKYTGVISAIVGLGDNDIFRRLHVSGLADVRRETREDYQEAAPAELQAAIAESTTEYMGTAENSPQPHMQRAANYMFFQNRYNSRSLSATLRYSPQLVAGMPCLILDPMRGQKSRFVQGEFGDTLVPDSPTGWRYTPLKSADELRDAFSRKKPRKPAGTHFVGILNSVEHTLNAQGGAQTRIQLSMCREHNEIANIFADDDGDGRPEAHMVKRTRRSSVIRPATGTALAESNAVVDGSFTAAIRGQFSEEGSNLDRLNLQADRILGGQWRPNTRYSVEVVRDDTGSPVTTDNEGNEIRQSYMVDSLTGQAIGTALPGEGAQSVKVVVRRVWTNSTPKAVNFRFEDMARPPWMANVFSPKNIGEQYYQKMFGCDSIMDGRVPIVGEDVNVEDENSSNRVVVGNTEDEDNPYEFIKIPFARFNSPSGATENPTEQEVMIPKDLLTKGNSTQEVADQLAELWIGMKEMGVDTEKFIDIYTQRAMASLPKVMGTANRSLRTKQFSATTPISTENQNFEGFHCWAYGDFEQLKKGSPANYRTVEMDMEHATERLQNANPASPQRALDANVDTRKRRYEKVQAYLAELDRQRGAGGPTEPE